MSPAAKTINFTLNGRPVAAGAAAALAGLALVSTLAAVVIGIVVMTSK